MNYSHSFIEPETLAYFNGLVAGLGIDSNGHLLMAPIIEYLKNSEPEHQDVLELNAPILEALIVPQACFPFSHSISLTRDAFCRAIILLTKRCKTVLGQGGSRLRHTTSRQRLFLSSQHYPILLREKHHTMTCSTLYRDCNTLLG